MKARFDPALTQRVRSLIADRGRASLAPDDPRFEGVCATPEMNAVLNRVAPIAEALFLVMSADGLCSMEEKAALLGALRTITDDELSEPAIEALIERLEPTLAAEVLSDRISRVGSQLAGDRDDSKVAIELSAALIVADGIITDDERHVLEQLAEETGHDPDAALALLG